MNFLACVQAGENNGKDGRQGYNGGELCRRADRLSTANPRLRGPGRWAEQLVVPNLPGLNVTDFFVCRVAVKHRRAAVLSLSKYIALSASWPARQGRPPGEQEKGFGEALSTDVQS